MREVAHSRGEVGRVCAAGSHATAELPPCSNPDNNKGIGLLEETVKMCDICQANARSPPKSCGTWTWPSGPWRRIHLDFAGPYLGKMFLVIIDAHTKFLDIVPMTHATTNGVIEALRHLFAIFGLPEHLVSDNGSQFTSESFQRFVRENGVKMAFITLKQRLDTQLLQVYSPYNVISGTTQTLCYIKSYVM